MGTVLVKSDYHAPGTIGWANSLAYYVNLYCEQGVVLATASGSTFTVYPTSFKTYALTNLWAVASGGYEWDGYHLDTRSIYGYVDFNCIDGKTYVYLRTATGTNIDLRLLSSETGVAQVLTWTPTGAITLNTANYFTSANKNSRTINVPIIVFSAARGGRWYYGNGGVSMPREGSAIRYADYYYESAAGNSDVTAVYATVTLNAPPTFTSTDVSFTNSPSANTSVAYAGKTTATVTISDLSAKYGGDITSCVLKIGSQTSESRTTNGTLSIDLAEIGKFTPQVIVTDSRGQVTTKNLADITVSSYPLPTTSFTVDRIDASSQTPADEGTAALVIATFTYCDSISNLLEPLVNVGSESATITWYTAYDISTGIFSGAVNWTNYNPSSGLVLYGLLTEHGSTQGFDIAQSFTIKIVAKDSRNTFGLEITQTLSTAYWPIDFYAGGHGVAFGAAALFNGFFVNMDPYIGIPNNGQTGHIDKAIYDKIVTDYGWSEVITTSPVVAIKVKELIKRLLDGAVWQ